jgi:hypothetical protein
MSSISGIGSSSPAVFLFTLAMLSYMKRMVRRQMAMSWAGSKSLIPFVKRGHCDAVECPYTGGLATAALTCYL